MPNLEEVIWCQEEPKNNGSWFFVEPLIEETLANAKAKVSRARYAGRQASASPATGSAKRHTLEQGALWPMRWVFRPAAKSAVSKGLSLALLPISLG
jgi:2-oxoglutarate dehydrogenase complex dehydrogenase (E1) component-like enzyme